MAAWNYECLASQKIPYLGCKFGGYMNIRFSDHVLALILISFIRFYEIFPLSPEINSCTWLVKHPQNIFEKGYVFWKYLGSYLIGAPSKVWWWVQNVIKLLIEIKFERGSGCFLSPFGRREKNCLMFANLIFWHRMSSWGKDFRLLVESTPLPWSYMVLYVGFLCTLCSALTLLASMMHSWSYCSKPWPQG